MIFTAPLALLGLAALPAILLLLRLNPPPPRQIAFPPLALLRNLVTQQRTPRSIPIWLLLLRLATAALIILGLAGPSLHPSPALPGSGTILLVIDNGWAAAADWPARRAAAKNIIAAAAQSSRGIAILATAPSTNGDAPIVKDILTPAQADQAIDAMQPWPWPVDRDAAAEALREASETTRVYIADGITDGPGFPEFLKALSPSRIIATRNLPALLLPPHLAADGGLVDQIDNPPANAQLVAHAANGDVLANVRVTASGFGTIKLPLPLANKIAFLTLDGPATAGGTLLLDGSAHADLVGLAAGSFSPETPFLGPLYFIRRALPPGAKTFSGNLGQLIADKANVIILADVALDPAEQQAAQSYVAQGGILVRFAGPISGASPDPISPDPLLPGDRRLGGALTWTTPQAIAPFPPDAAFAGLPSDPDVTVSRQILADPTKLVPATVWARLSDATPLVLGTRIGKGYIVYFLTTANADWSDLALSGLLPNMLNRVTALAGGAAPRPNLVLPLQSALSAFGMLGAGTDTINLEAGRLATTLVSPAYPPGLYGEADVSLALNLGGHVTPPAAAPLPNVTPLTGPVTPLNFGPQLIAMAILLLAFDLALSLQRRGLLTLQRAAFLLVLLVPTAVRAQTAALQPTLGYIRTGNPATDQTTADGLSYLSADVSAHTSAQLADPIGLDPAVDDLTLYPLIYWPVLPNAPALSAAACTALAGYMQHGGLLVIDTIGGDPNAPGSGAGFAPGTGDALARVTACLALPPLVPLNPDDALAHCFYIVQDFSGRFTGAPVMIATEAARDADSVTPVVIGQNDWAGAWARDSTGAAEQTPLPGGDDQRVIADRFGTNLVIYALTGSYKADQSDVPALLDKLGQ
jgi:hypothetical protein